MAADDNDDLVDLIAVPKPLWMFNKVMDNSYGGKAGNFSQGQGGPDEQGP